jgi:hypothetical protein
MFIQPGLAESFMTLSFFPAQHPPLFFAKVVFYDLAVDKITQKHPHRLFAIPFPLLEEATSYVSGQGLKIRKV